MSLSNVVISVAGGSAAAAPADAQALVAVASPATDAGGSAVNQDRAFTQTDAATGITTIGVFDGHGTYGAEIAQGAAEVAAAADPTTPLTDLMVRLEERARAVIAAIPDVVSEHGAFYRRAFYGSGAPVRGGSTATINRINPDGSMEMAHLGDSDIVYWDTDDAEASNLMVDHSAASVTEFCRIRAACATAIFRFDDQGGRLLRGRQPRPVFVPAPLAAAPAGDGPAADEWILNPKGGYCYADVRGTWGVYFEAPDGREALAMTRALGDFHLKRFGLIATPSVSTAPPPAAGQTRAIVVASDGLWDAVQHHEVRDLVRRPDLLGNAAAATAALLTWGLEKARGHFGSNVDNIAVSVTYVTVPLPAPEPVAATCALGARCALHGRPGALGSCPEEEPPALGYSRNSWGDYSTFAPLCACPGDPPVSVAEPEADPYMVHLWRVEDTMIASAAPAARAAVEADAERVRRNRHRDPADYARTAAAAAATEEEFAAAAAEKIHEAIVAGDHDKLEVAVARWGRFLEPESYIMTRAREVLAGGPEDGEGPASCGCRGRYCGDCWPSGYETD